MCEGLQTLMNEDQAFLPLGMIGAGVMLQKYLILNDSGLHNVLTLSNGVLKNALILP